MTSSPASRLERLVGQLREFYGLLPTPPSDTFMLFVWEVLSFQTPPLKRDAAFGALKRNRSLTPDSMMKVAPKKLEESVRLTGSYFEQRLRALKTGITVFQRDPDLAVAIKGPLPAAQEALAVLPQMGEGGADRMLLFAGEHLILPMDTAVWRLVRRLGYDDVPDQDLPQSLDAYKRASIYLSHHAAVTCSEDEPHCHVCPLRSDCPYGESR
jgi:endonuclease III